MPDTHSNVAYSLVATAPSPATSGTTLVVTAGEGSRFPQTGSFQVMIVPAGSQPVWAAGGNTGGNFEICRATISSNTLTLTRAQEGTTARSIIVGDQVFAGPTNKWWTDIENNLPNIALNTATLAVRASADQGYFVESGCALTPNATPTTLDLAAGTASFGNADVTVSSQTAIATTLASLAPGTAGQSVWVAVDIDSSQTVHFNAGTAAVSPTIPAFTSTHVPFGWLWVPYGATNVDTNLLVSNGNAKLLDARIVLLEYALLAGRTGGQTFYGDTASGGALTLGSTANATKGKINLGASSSYDEANTRLGLGVTPPLGTLHVVGPTPASVSTTPGTQGDKILLTTLAGGATTKTDTGVGGISGGIQLNIGNGGTADSATTSATGGAAGTGQIQGGAGGAVAASATTAKGGNGSLVQLKSGAGGAVNVSSGASATATGGNGGEIFLQSGNGGQEANATSVGTGGAGGLVSLQAGTGGASATGTGTHTGGAGGNVLIQSGPGGTGTSANGAAGTIVLAASSGTAASATVLTIANPTITVADAINLAVGTSTGTKFGTSTSQKIGFYNATPVVQAASISAISAGGTGTAAGGWDTSGHRDAAITSMNSVITALHNLGLIG